MALVKAAEWREAVQQHKDELGNLLEEMAKDTHILGWTGATICTNSGAEWKRGYEQRETDEVSPRQARRKVVKSPHCPNRHYGSLILLGLCQSLCSSERQQHTHHSRYTSVMIQGVAHHHSLQMIKSTYCKCCISSTNSLSVTSSTTNYECCVHIFQPQIESNRPAKRSMTYLNTHGYHLRIPVRIGLSKHLWLRRSQML